MSKRRGSQLPTCAAIVACWKGKEKISKVSLKSLPCINSGGILSNLQLHLRCDLTIQITRWSREFFHGKKYWAPTENIYKNPSDWTHQITSMTQPGDVKIQRVELVTFRGGSVGVWGMEKRGTLGQSGVGDVWRLVSLVSLGQWLRNLYSKTKTITYQAETSWDLSFPFASVFVNCFCCCKILSLHVSNCVTDRTTSFPPLSWSGPRERFNNVRVFSLWLFAWGRLNWWDLHCIV